MMKVYLAYRGYLYVENHLIECGCLTLQCYSTVEALWKQLWYFVLKHRWPILSPNPLNENIQRLRPKMLCQDKEKWNPKNDSGIQPNMTAVLPLDVSCGSKLSGLMATLNQFPIKILRCIRTLIKIFFIEIFCYCNGFLNPVYL